MEHRDASRARPMSLINSLFSAQSGLRAANAGVNATSNNVANSATPGYNRRCGPSHCESDSCGTTQLWQWVQCFSNWTQLGQLVEHAATERSSESMVLSGTEYCQLTSIERLFDETQSTTPRGELDAFFDSLSLATADPSDLGLRKQVAHTAQRLAESINRTSNSIDEGRTTYKNNIESSLPLINNKLAEIADLNAKNYGAGGAMGAGDLADRRDQIIRDLSERAGITADLTADGQATVYMGGHAIVSKSEARPLTLNNGPPISISAEGRRASIDVSADAVVS